MRANCGYYKAGAAALDPRAAVVTAGQKFDRTTRRVPLKRRLSLGKFSIVVLQGLVASDRQRKRNVRMPSLL